MRPIYFFLFLWKRGKLTKSNRNNYSKKPTKTNYFSLIFASEDCRAQILQSDRFNALCDQVYSQCRRMEVDEWVNLLKHLCLLGVPATSKISQVTLQVCELM